MFSNHNPAESLRRLRSILESKDDIWVKTIPDPSQKAMIQVSLDCTHLGQKYRVPPIQVGDPVNLMNYAPHEAWAANPDLRTQVQRGRLRLMTTEESDAHFTQKASLLGKSVNAVKNEALQAENDQVTHKPLSPTLPNKEEDVAPKFHSVKDGLERESTINPRVMQLCANAAKDVPVSDRLAEGPLLFELQQMEPILLVEDLDYVMSFGNYKRVKDWARSAQKSKPDADDDKVEI